jgi:hypothetical protein|tara:strand:+ start:1688 stop:2995 length:1308 start_codon:yes stop_codon:yes gene_type:complete
MGLLDNTTQQAYYQGNNYGNYQFTSLEDIINQFIVAYTGENKIIQKVKRTDVAFHAQRALQELSFDTFKSIKSQEITLPPSNTMILPQDYVNYTRVLWVDSSGIKHPLYPTKHTQNPTPIFQNSDGDYSLTATGTLIDTDATIVLDSEYLNVQVGMIVSSPNIPNGSLVIATSNTGSVTTIEINNDATYTGTETLTFTPQDSSLILEEESTFVLENVTWDISEDKITQSPNTDVSNITVGMLVSHEDFPIGTTVIDVNGAVITTSNNSTEASTATTNEVTFISTPGDSTTWSNYKSATPSENQNSYDDDTYLDLQSERYGLDPQHAQINGSYFIDDLKGLIHFSSNMSGRTIVLDYISDSLGTDGEMQVHKFAEEAMYKSIAYAICSTTISGQQLVPRFKKEKFAAIRQAKLRLSNIKLEEITQILRGKSKWIKH